MKLTEIKPYENNPRVNDQSVDKVAASIKEFGFRSPIIVDKDKVIIAGHTRYKAAKKLGLKDVPVIVAEDMTPEQVKAYRLADNKAGEESYWDFDLLDSELADITSFDMEEFGFDKPVSYIEDLDMNGLETPPAEPTTFSCTFQFPIEERGGLSKSTWTKLQRNSLWHRL